MGRFYFSRAFMKKASLLPHIDYYINADGNLVLTEKYHLNRGYCCQSGCLHCPYNYQNKSDPNIPAELNSNWMEEALEVPLEEEEEKEEED